MARVCTDRLTSALREVSIYGSHGMPAIEHDRPPIFDYLLAARLIEEVHSNPNCPDQCYWALSTAGMEELKCIDRRFKRHFTLLCFFALSFMPFCAKLSLVLGRLPHVGGYLLVVAFVSCQLSLASLTCLAEAFLSDYSKGKSFKHQVLLGFLLLIIFFLSIFLTVGLFPD